MSAAPKPLRRADLVMDEDRAKRFLRNGYAGRLATTSPDGWPYVVPLLYVFDDEVIYMHSAAAKGHLRTNIDHNPRACFLLDEPGSVYAYGRFECDSSLSYTSVMAFGTISLVDRETDAVRFFNALMAKYSPEDMGRPKGFYPRLPHISIYALRIDRLSGKEITLPASNSRWPRIDRSKTPNAIPPSTEASGERA